MSQGPDATDERQQRLDAIRAELTAEQDAGRKIRWADWIERHPDLVADLVGMIEEFRSRDFQLDSGATIAVGPDQTVAINADQTTAIPPVVAETRLADETIATDPNAGFETLDTPATPNQPRGTPAAGAKVRYIGDYEILSILGQGGMGVVYRARQVSLNRPVALKMIRNVEFADDDQIRRFKNEAEAVATLDHPGIVPIYEVGTFEDQRYFSMKLVAGQGMDQRIKALATDPRTAVTLLAEISDAIHHAHQRGILHRDLKPANILIDTQGHAHVTDFGLAKRIDEEAGLTVSGSVMGTPAYMAPEQALGQTAQITTASDVYGLGAIFYSALTGLPPFQGDSVLNTLDRVRSEPPAPPSRVNATVSRDLEVICLKCLEKDSRRRYPSAQALGDDLRRWLNGEPITARPVGPAVRAWMWCKRRPALAGLAAALVVALITGAGGIVWQWREAVTQRDRAQVASALATREARAARTAEGEARTARDVAQTSEKAAVASEQAAQTSEKAAVAARALAEQNAQLAGIQATQALGTIQFLIEQVRVQLAGAGLEDLRTSLLNAAIDRVDKVAASYDKSLSKEATALAALQELGRIYRQVGNVDKADTYLRKALEIARERVKIKSGSDPSRLNLALCCREVGFLDQEYRRDLNACLVLFREALAILIDIDQYPKNDGFQLPKRRVRSELADAYGNVGSVLYRNGDLAAARDNYLKAYNLRRELADEFKDDITIRRVLGYSLIGLAESTFRVGNPTQAEEYYRRALELREEIAAREPKNLNSQRELADIHFMIGEYRIRTDDRAGARRSLTRSREIYEATVAADSKDAVRRRALGVAWYRLGNLADAEHNPDAARADFATATRIREELAQFSENNTLRQIELMLALAHSGPVDRAVELADRFAAGPNVDTELRIDLSRAYTQAAQLLPPDQAERAGTLLVRAVESIRTAVRNGFRDRVYLATEPDLVPLRTREDFKNLLAEITSAH